MLGTTFLTGRAISVQDAGGIFAGKSVILLGLIIILIVAAIIVFLYRKFSSRQFSLGTKKTGFKELAQTSESAENRQDAMIDKGEKQEATIVALNLKNLGELQNAESTNAIDSALWKAKESGAKIYSDGEYRIIILAPVLSREKEIPLAAVELARAVEKSLTAHNKRHHTKINFGIAVNEGTLIVEFKNGKFRFMSMNNLISATKRMSSLSEGDVLMSESLHRKLVGKIKTQKVPNKNLWKIDQVADRSNPPEYLKTFSHKQAHKKH